MGWFNQISSSGRSCTSVPSGRGPFAVAAVLAYALIAVPVSSRGADTKIDFGRDIQPIFAKRCFPCHGPDKNEGGLRLNKRESALAELESGARAVVPGDSKRSALLTRISAEDDGERMPPEGKPLSKAEIELIGRWVAGGAEWQSHWAFRPPQPQEPPTVKN